MENQRLYLDWIKTELNINSNDDWYNVTIADLREREGNYLLTKYGHSLFKLLKSVYPDVEWYQWKFSQVPKNFWDDMNNQLAYVRWFEKMMGISDVDKGKWYDVSSDMIIQNHGGGFLQNYGRSVYRMVKAVYPDYYWVPWNFKRVSSNFWNNSENIKSYMDETAQKLDIKDPSEWWKVSNKQMNDSGAQGLIKKFGGLAKTVQKAYPDAQNLNPSLFSKKTKRAAQRWLKICLQKLFPWLEIFEDYKHPTITWDQIKQKTDVETDTTPSATGNKSRSSPIEFDLWLPKVKLAVEYQGEQHYNDLQRAFGPSSSLELYTHRDKQKQELCDLNGITLLQVPYWWNGDLQSLAATISIIRPDLVDPKKVSSIPIDVNYQTEKDRKKQMKSIIEYLSHPREWIDSIDPTGWWITEKYDGIRAYWDGKQMYSKRGNLIPIPPEFTKNLPEAQLDGELWCGYEDHTLSKLMAIVKSKSNTSEEGLMDIKWSSVVYMIFDAPGIEGNYKYRYDEISKIVQPLTDSGEKIKMADIQECQSTQHLMESLEKVQKIGGEGLIIRNPNTLNYQSGRNDSVLKVKPYLDTEVRMIEPSTTSYSLICEQKNGQTCIVKCASADYLHPPAKGEILRVKYSGYYSSGKLKYPIFLSTRLDMTWEDVLNSDN
eukprot:TRINITY_DN4544_c0_g1_i1.p1 TRINITY_DN4544_c0_g1~~TRINITY_DN4544_c0_g1_i1.p1  ORF type:complete len:657 (+),score=99.41 TRINITY_DN4544_c0_g1_i1:645-2615(+)